MKVACTLYSVHNGGTFASSVDTCANLAYLSRVFFERMKC